MDTDHTYVALNVVRKSGPGDCSPGVRARSSAPLDGSLLDLREILVQDKVICEDDKFYIDGRAVGRTAEAHTKWTDILREILVIGSETCQPQTAPNGFSHPDGFDFPSPHDTPLDNGRFANYQAQAGIAHQNDDRWAGKPRRPDNFFNTQKDAAAERNFLTAPEEVATNISTGYSPVGSAQQLHGTDVAGSEGGFAPDSYAKTHSPSYIDGSRVPNAQSFESPRTSQQLDGTLTEYRTNDVTRNRSFDSVTSEADVNGRAGSTYDASYPSSHTRDTFTNGSSVRSSTPATDISSNGTPTLSSYQAPSAQYANAEAKIQDGVLTSPFGGKSRMKPLRLSEDLSQSPRNSIVGSPRNSIIRAHDQAAGTPTRARAEMQSRTASIDSLQPIRELSEAGRKSPSERADFTLSFKPQDRDVYQAGSNVTDRGVSGQLQFDERRQSPAPIQLGGEVDARAVTGAHANAIPVNGAAVNGTAINGEASNGRGVDGAIVNRSSPNNVVGSTQVNGSLANEVTLGRSTVNGGIGATQDSPGKYRTQAPTESSVTINCPGVSLTGVNNHVPLVQGTVAAPLVGQPRVDFAPAPNGQTAATQDAYAVFDQDTASAMQNGPAWNHAATSENDTPGSSSRLVRGDDEPASTQSLPAGNSAKSAERGDGQGAECANKQDPECVAKVDGVNGQAVERAGVRKTAECANDQAGGYGSEHAKPTDSSIQEVSQPRRVESLNDLEKRALLAKCELGAGLDVSDAYGPKHTDCAALPCLDLSSVTFTAAHGAVQEVVVSSSSREGAYAKCGWSTTCEHPWVDACPPAGDCTAYVTGRYVYATCEIGLREGSRPSASPELQRAVETALASEDLRWRAGELERVFRRFGHFYPAAIEMGGMKTMSCSRQTSAQRGHDVFEAEMKAALAKQFGGECETANAGVRVEACESAVASLHQSMVTVGGCIQEYDVAKWKASLCEPTSWAVTRIARVESTIDLFDAATKAKILASTPQAVAAFEAVQAALPKVPLYRLYSHHPADHFYTTNSAERDHAVRAYGYAYELPAAQILASPAEHSVPFFRVYRNREHFYTTDEAEKQRAIAGARDEGIAGFVYAARQNGTVPLYRLYNPHADDHFYTTSAPEKETCLNSGVWNDEGVACYVYP